MRCKCKYAVVYIIYNSQGGRGRVTRVKKERREVGGFGNGTFKLMVLGCFAFPLYFAQDFSFIRAKWRQTVFLLWDQVPSPSVGLIETLQFLIANAPRVHEKISSLLIIEANPANNIFTVQDQPSPPPKKKSRLRTFIFNLFNRTFPSLGKRVLVWLQRRTSSKIALKKCAQN